ncbi:exported protein, unknown function [Hepatocystis sp. ex Piliocolobus tephrosceles]|nr:exported protein, unknown function [Hepatocystis sp. ex Piliocolobus tephrosceles]
MSVKLQTFFLLSIIYIVLLKYVKYGNNVNNSFNLCSGRKLLENDVQNAENTVKVQTNLQHDVVDDLDVAGIIKQVTNVRKTLLDYAYNKWQNIMYHVVNIMVQFCISGIDSEKLLIEFYTTCNVMDLHRQHEINKINAIFEQYLSLIDLKKSHFFVGTLSHEEKGLLRELEMTAKRMLMEWYGFQIDFWNIWFKKQFAIYNIQDADS